MSAISSAVRREKALPDIPVDVDVSESILELDELQFMPSPKVMASADTSKALPSIKIENMLSEEEMVWLHELWNGAVSGARTHRKRRSRNHIPRRISAPITIPGPRNMPPTPSSADPSIMRTGSLSTGTRRRWGFFSARPCPEMQEVEKKGPTTLEKWRVMAQDRFKKKLRYAKSAPNLGDRAELFGQATVRPTPAEVLPEVAEAGSPSILPSPCRSAKPNEILRPEEMDENAIYFIIDPNWRASQGSVRFQFITPVPDRPTSLGRPDSPHLSRYHSVDQLSSAAEDTSEASTVTGLPEVHASDLVDEFYSYLEL